MNILELCDFYSNYSSNFIPSLECLERELEKRNHNVYYVFSTRNLSKDFLAWEKPFEDTHNVTLLDFSKFSLISKVVELIRKNNIKIVHGHFLASFFFSEIKRRSPKDVLFFEHIHSAPFLGKKSFAAWVKRIRNAFLLSHKIPKITVSEAIIPITKFVYPFSQVVACRNSIYFPRLKGARRNADQTNNILLFGYNYYVKGVDLAIDAVCRLSQECNIHLDIVMGDNFEQNKATISRRYGSIPSCVTLLPPTNNIQKLYDNHRIFLNASRAEGISYAVIEAYYCGLLCVLSDIPATLETNLPNVVYFSNGNSESLYVALKEALAKIGNYSNDIKYVEEKFSITEWCTKLIKIFGLF